MRRRAIYRFIVRSVPNPFMEALDCADPNLNTPVRSQTLTALQALALWNDLFMLRQSQELANRLEGQSADHPTTDCGRRSAWHSGASPIARARLPGGLWNQARPGRSLPRDLQHQRVRLRRLRAIHEALASLRREIANPIPPIAIAALSRTKLDGSGTDSPPTLSMIPPIPGGPPWPDIGGGSQRNEPLLDEYAVANAVELWGRPIATVQVELTNFMSKVSVPDFVPLFVRIAKTSNVLPFVPFATVTIYEPEGLLKPEKIDSGLPPT